MIKNNIDIDGDGKAIIDKLMGLSGNITNDIISTYILQFLINILCLSTKNFIGIYSYSIAINTAALDEIV